MTVAADPREALIQRRQEIALDAEDGLVTAVAELASIDARLAEFDRQREPLDVSGVLSALDEAAPPEPERFDSEERIALARRRKEISPEVVAGDGAAIAELASIDERLSELARQQELVSLAEAETAKRARLAAEAKVEEQRAAARKTLKKLEGKRNAKGAAVEDAIDALIGAVDDWGAHDIEMEEAWRVIDPDARTPNNIVFLRDRIAYRLFENGLGELDYPFAPRGRTPLGGA